MAGEGDYRHRPGGRGAGTLTLDTHRPLEGAIGIVLMVAPFLLSFGLGEILDFSVEAIVVSAVIGVPIATLAFAGGRSGDPVSPSLHSVLDTVLGAALLLAAVLFALAQQGTAAVFLALATIAYGALVVATRYTERY